MDRCIVYRRKVYFLLYGKLKNSDFRIYHEVDLLFLPSVYRDDI